MSARISEASALVLIAALALAGCAHAPTDPQARLALYRQHAGTPVAGIDYVRNMRWEALGDQALAVWPRRDTGFLVELASPCPGLDQASAIQLTRSEGRVRSRQDAVRVVSIPGSRPMQRTPCPIMLISPIRDAPADAPGPLREVDDTEGSAP
ncbi:DUF6491 family protein [Lysobacter auxotrophicus]|uniref:DUF6491 family protein n=1 Tax=Lysobacter auxotrophicus TaxID=2992573 RepID=A0ABN6UKE4_9GAMM|nr:DUF6491 family protein [Lysobacter auxotrophicus]BDU16726.1 DUF6491 family protein [Lysobacter auxotrophicus]